MKKRIFLLLILVLSIAGCGKKNEVSNGSDKVYECVTSNSFLYGATKNVIRLESKNDLFAYYVSETTYVYTEGTQNIDELINKDKKTYEGYSKVKGVTTKYEKIDNNSYKTTFSLDIESLDYSSFIAVEHHAASDNEVKIFKKNQLIDDVLKNYSLDYTCELK